MFISSPIILLQQSAFSPKGLRHHTDFNGSAHVLRCIKVIIESSTLLSQDLSDIPSIFLNRLI